MLVASIEDWNLKTAAMLLDLFDCAGSEVVAGGEHDLEALVFEEVGYFGEIGGLADSVDSDEDHDIGLVTGPFLERLLDDVDLLGGVQNLGQALAHRLADGLLQRTEQLGLLVGQVHLHRRAHFARDLLGHVLAHQVILYFQQHSFHILFTYYLVASQITYTPSDLSPDTFLLILFLLLFFFIYFFIRTLIRRVKSFHFIFSSINICSS